MSSKDYTITRRDFVGVAIGIGFALAVQPITAWALHTSSEGLITDNIYIPTNQGNMPAYRAMPVGKGPFPVIIVIHEIFGVHEYIQDVCRRLAKNGYLAICPDLFFRQGDPTQIKDIQKIMSDIVAKTSLQQSLTDLDATIDWVKSTRIGDTSKIGVTGFCWGGRMTWLYCAHNHQIKAGVAWYGPLTGKPTPQQPLNPIDIAATLHIPVLGLYGGKDTHIPQEDIERMRTTLKKGKSSSEIIVYPDAEHGFHADYRPSYNQKDAQDGWQRLLNWFKKKGV